MPQQVRCTVVPLQRVYELCFALAREIRASGFQPDLVVAVARGGFVPARLLCDFLRQRDLASVSVVHYASGARRQPEARLRHPVAAEVEGRRVLVVDDVNDSGDTLARVASHLRERGAAEVRFAVCHEKDGSGFRADYCAERVPHEGWMLYQWALVEDTLGFLDQMDPPPAAFEDAARRLAADHGLTLDRATWEKLAFARGAGP